jgi:2-polyprenyl-6-methoxyphenol hydroxylase-like FAD-dependent oxidoreductase
MRRHAEIAGGGIGGLGLGIMLAQHGWSVRIHERAPAIREIGSGISLRNNCITVLERYGAFSRLEPHGTLLRQERHYDGKGRFLQKRSLTGQHRTLVLPRQSLVDGLASAAREAGAEIVTSSHIVGAEPTGALIDEAGRRFEADLAIGADGVRSKVRSSLELGATFKELDTRVNRFLVNSRSFTADDEMFEHWSGNTRVGIMPAGPGRSFVYNVMPGSDEAACQMPVDPKSWTAAFPLLGDVFRVLGESAGTQYPYPLVRTPKWFRGQVALIGDAAHGMPPTLGQGAGLTMLNAHALATFVSKAGSVSEGLEKWESAVRGITDATMRWAIRYDKLTRSWPRGLRGLRPHVIWAFGRYKALNRRMRVADLGLSLIEARLS